MGKKISAAETGIAALVCLGWFSSPASADWNSVGGDAGTGSDASIFSSLAVSGQTPYVVFSGFYAGWRHIWVKRYNGFDWEQDGNYLNTVSGGDGGFNPRIVASNLTPYVVWEEYNTAFTNDQIHVKFHNGVDWQSVGGVLNHQANHFARHPALAFSGTTPYTAWEEDNSADIAMLYSKFFNGLAWQDLGGPANMNLDQNAEFPSLAVSGTTPFLAWGEFNGTNSLVQVKYWNGLDWQGLPLPANRALIRDATAPALAFQDTTPYLAWQESNGLSNQVYAGYYNGLAWQPLGGSLNRRPDLDAENPDLGFSNNIPFVTWDETNGASHQVYAGYFHDGTWHDLDNSLNVNFDENAMDPHLAFCGSTPYVAWQEDNGVNWDGDQLFVKWSDFSASTVTPIATSTPAPGIGQSGFFIIPSLFRAGQGRQVQFRFFLDKSSWVELAIYDLSGQRVVGEKANYPGGWQTWSWDGQGSGSGLWMAVLEAGGYRQVRKFVLVR